MQELQENTSKKVNENIKNKIKILKDKTKRYTIMTAVSMLTAVVCLGGYGFHLAEGGSIEQDATQKINNIAIEEAMQSEEYNNHVDAKRVELYNQYKNGEITGSEYRSSMQELYSEDYIKDNSEMFLSEEKQEEINDLNEDLKTKDSQYAIALANLIIGAGSSVVGAVSYLNKEKNALKIHQEEMQLIRDDNGMVI